MKNSRVTFFKKCYPNSIPKLYQSSFFWKVIELEDGTAKAITIATSNEINIDDDDDFETSVAFIKNVLCDDSRGEYAQEISREEFDDEFKKIVSVLNDLSSL